jgi:serine/threonine-protein kinase
LAVKPGEILHQRYRIDSLIGRGGMGQVFSATDLHERQTQVAIKVVSRLLVDDVMMARLHREAEAASRIQSEWVPRVLEVGDTDTGETFLVMERLFGQSLSARIREAGALDWPEVARIGEDILRALIDAHTAGIVHRDLKPSNVFLAEKAGRTRAMVLDFGVCKVDGVDVERLTGTGESIGTVAYMAPEQIRGAARVDERADLYAFGVVVFEMLSARLPHEGPSQMAILASKLENPAARIHHWSKHPIPEGTDELLGKTLAREPKDRAANAQDLLKAWRILSKSDKLVASVPPPPVSALDPASDPSRPSRPLSSPSSSPPGVVHPTDADITIRDAPAGRAASTEKSRGATRLALLLAGASLVIALVVVTLAFRRGPRPPATGVASPDSAVPQSSSAIAPTDEPDPAESASIELPDDGPRASGGPTSSPVKGRPLSSPRARPVRPATPPGPPPKTSTPHITSQPRY